MTNYLKENLLRLRKIKGWSQEKLSEEAGVSYQTVFRAEAGVVPRGANIEKLAKALGVTQAQLFSDPLAIEIEEKVSGDVEILNRLASIESKLEKQSPAETGPRQELIDLVLRIPESALLNDDIFSEIKSTIEATFDDVKSSSASKRPKL